MLAPILKYPLRANRSRQRLPIARCVALALIALACSEAATPEPADPTAAAQERAPAREQRVPTPLLAGNQFRNPGFETGADGWGRIERPDSIGFEVVSKPVHAGRGAAHLVAAWRPGDRRRPVAVQSVTQTISPPRFPDRIGGWYRVERWEHSSDRDPLQLQVIVAVIGDPRTREIVQSNDPDHAEVDPALDNLQIRYQLAGPSEDPEDGSNVRNRVIERGPPTLGDWVHFDLPIKFDFEQLWGTQPANYRELRAMFIVRWDDKEESTALHAEVYYDDLFFGFEDL